MDWIAFLEDNRINYVTNSPNVKKDNINVKCPWCGEDDPSEHLGISLVSEAWGCWRDMSHRGKSPVWLVQALLGCSKGQAVHVVQQYSRPDPENLEEAIASLSETSTSTFAMAAAGAIDETAARNWLLPADFKEIRQTGLTSKFWRYLQNRGFETELDVVNLIKKYGLLCCMTGRWKDRLIIPIYQNEKLIGWTGRALGQPVTAPRYLSTSDEIKTTVFNQDELLRGGDRLLIVEGPFDALKVDFYGRIALNASRSMCPVRATCVFGVSVTMPQVVILRALVSKFKQTRILFDPNAQGQAMQLSDWINAPLLDMASFGIWHLGAGHHDPGAYSKAEVHTICDDRFWQ